MKESERESVCLRMCEASKMQQKAIEHVRGPARVIAGPGSGKTFTIIQRILKLITRDHVDPDKILTITFTRAAALEMQSRYLKETEKDPYFESIKKTTHFGTFHGICYAILKESGLINRFSLIKEQEKRKITEIILKNRNVEGADEYDNITLFLDAVSRRKNLIDGELPLNLNREEFHNIYLEYEDMLNQQKLLDFDDMILKCFHNLQTNPGFCQKWQKKFDYILVDEFQDINEIQYRLVRLLALPSDNLFVVGDDDQSIYGFRGSAPLIMRKFTEDYKGARELFLTENYRSREEIVKLADQMIRRNTDRFDKTPYPVRPGGAVKICFRESRKEEELQLLTDIKYLPKETLYSSAVILRTNREVLEYTAFLKQNGVNVRENVKQNEDILHHFITEDFRAFLKFCYEGNKRADFLKIMNKPNLFLSRQALTEEVVKKDNILDYYRNNREMRHIIEKLFKQFNMASELSPASALRYFRKVMGYDEYLRQKNGGKKADELLRWADQIQTLFKQMKQDEKTDFFLEKQEKTGDVKKQTQNIKIVPGISVITMHSSKGLEFHCVFLPDLNEGVIPGKNSETLENIEEERRLLYVAITRARDSLYLYYTGERNRKLTRFLEGIIPPQIQ